MKQNILKFLGYSLILLFLFSCRKEKLAKMEQGIYDVTHIRTFYNGQQETFHCLFSGPSEGDHSYFFQPKQVNTGASTIEVYKILKKSKKYEKVKFYVDSPLLTYPLYFYGKIDKYDLGEDRLIIYYSNEEYSFSGVMYFNRI
jgi:hypothetical protein